VRVDRRDGTRQLGVVEQVTASFLDHYLGDGSIDDLLAAGDAPGVARFTADPWAREGPVRAAPPRRSLA
jgi:hypothetical protein